MKIQDIAIVRREIAGVLVPHGQDITLVPGTEVLIIQALGDRFTLNVQGNLVSIRGEDADAIGKEDAYTCVKTQLKNKPFSENLIWEQLKTCYDPEISVNIVDLGLIYDMIISRMKDDQYHIGIKMTLTAPGCGMGPVIVSDIENKIKAISDVSQVDVVLIFDPPWDASMMSEAAKLSLGIL